MRFSTGSWYAGALGFSLIVVAGCGDDDGGPAPPRVPDAANGEYLVEHVTACGDCHTPRDAGGVPLPGQTLAGGVRFDLPFGVVYTRNITPDSATGIGSWSDAEIITAIRTGQSPEPPGGSTDEAKLFPIMPYWLYGHLTDADAQDIVAYLRSVPAVNNLVPSDSIPSTFRQVWPLQQGIPNANPNNSSQQRGKYLVTVAACIDCHTLPKSEVSGNPADAGVALQLFLAGGRQFGLGPLGTVHSKNITPDVATGIGSWSPTQIDSAIAYGYDDEGNTLCPPMPWPIYRGLTQSDRDAIVAYLRGIAPISHPVPEDSLQCPR
jgi:mono/diheme cytochrome c family protein